MAQMMFETFQVPSMSVQVDAMLALYASGRTTGVTLDVGNGVTHAVPVLEGCVLHRAVQRLSVGGRDLVQYMQWLLCQYGGYNLTSAPEVPLTLVSHLSLSV